MKGLYFYKLVSPYSEDVTKDCKLTVNEIDHNFVTLKDADVKSVSYNDEKQVITLTRNNGDALTVDLSKSFEDAKCKFDVEYDSAKGVITITHDDDEYVIDGLVTDERLSKEVLTEVISDSTLFGLGAKKSPLGLSPVEKTGCFKPVKKFVDLSEGEELPSVDERAKGDRYLIKAKISLYGCLYNFETVKKINAALTNGWRVPTKADWDNVLNAIEPCDEYRNHDSIKANDMLGKYAGKKLKSSTRWIEAPQESHVSTVTDNTALEEHYGDPIGTDNFKMSLLPSGFFDGNDVYAYFSKRGFYWSSTQCNATDVYVKRFDYDKTGVVQTVESPKSYFSLRFVKDYDGSNQYEVENIEGIDYETVLLPSENTKHGFSVWTSQNFASKNVNYDYIEPNNGLDLEVSNGYYIIEWNGKDWVRKEMSEGESVVLLEGISGETDCEYRLVQGELNNDAAVLSRGVLEIIEPQIDEINEVLSGHSEVIDNLTEVVGEGLVDESGVTTTLTDAIKSLEEDFIYESAIRQETDNDLDSAISALETKTDNEVNELNVKVDELNETISALTETEASERKSSDEDLQSQIDELKETTSGSSEALKEDLEKEIARAKSVEEELQETINEVDNDLTIAEGRLINSAEYDSENGVLTLKADSEDNNITVQFNGNYGEF